MSSKTLFLSGPSHSGIHNNDSESGEEIDIKYVEKVEDHSDFSWFRVNDHGRVIRGPREPPKRKEPKKREVKETKEVKKFNPYDINGRHFQLTLFGGALVYNAVKDYLTAKAAFIYLYSCRETCPNTGNEHYHIYVHFRTSVKLSQRKCHFAHLEPCRGSITANCNYVSKTGSSELLQKGIDSQNIIVDEIGTRPDSIGGRIAAEDLPTMTDKDIVMIDPRCHQAYIKARNILINNPDVDVDDWAKIVKVYYIQGGSGCGKTERAKQIVRDLGKDPKTDRNQKVNIVKCQDGFWSGIGEATIAIYDEFRSSSMKASEFINFIDYNRHNLNTKGGGARNNYTLIIITSVEKLSEIYKNMRGEPRLQWERRVELIDMYPESIGGDIDLDWA